MADPIVYDSYYSLFLQQDVNLYLSWSGIQTWGYLYGTPKALWFDKVNGSNSGPILTGDVLNIACHIGVATQLLTCRGLNDWTIAWGGSGSSTNWSLWTDANMTKGQQITLGQTVYITSQDPSYPGAYLIQYLPEYPTYLTAGPNTVPYQFQVRTESGGLLADESDIKKAPPPPDTRKQR